MIARNDKQGVAIRCCCGGDLRSDYAGRTSSVVYYDLLAKPLAEFGRHDTANDIIAAARREGNDQPNGPRRIVLGEHGNRVAKHGGRHNKAKATHRHGFNILAQHCAQSSSAFSQCLGRDVTTMA